MNTLVIDLSVDKPDFYSNEAINMLRENVQMAGYNCKMFSVTSAAPNEGKSYIAFNLARSLASLGKKTVFIDSDIRNSLIKKKYKITAKTQGLSEYLCDQCAEDDVVYKTTIDNLYMIFSGKRSPMPSELLSGKRFDSLLSSLKGTYDYIILDTPPINLVVDATIISKKADATVLVVKSYSTDRSQAISMKKQLETSGIKILGVVINLYDAHKVGYGKYGYGKYDYEKYGYRKYRYGEHGYSKCIKYRFEKTEINDRSASLISRIISKLKGR